MVGTATMPLLAVEHLTMRFGGLVAIDDLSFVANKGEITAIIGPNGAGKTSVFNVITRVFNANRGRVLFDGHDITGVPRHRVIDYGIARTFQNIELFEGATVLDNLLLGRHRFPYGNLAAELCWFPSIRRAEAEARSKVEDIIDFLELAPYRMSLVSALPYGVRKVVELGRALATEPRLLLLDEPASGLNPEEARDLAFWIDDIRSDLGITVVMIEHDMSLVAEAADRVMCMNAGRLLALGSASEVQSNPDVAAAYLGT
jgi:branched-chain amino acid transport system ATP-binding protein